MSTRTCPSLHSRFSHVSLNHQARVEVEEKRLRSKEPKRGTKDAKTTMAVVDARNPEKHI